MGSDAGSGTGRPGEQGGRRRAWAFALAWLVAAALAVTVGVVAVSSVGASVLDRGPLGDEIPDVRRAEQVARPDPDATRVRRDIDGPYGSFRVACRGVVAYGLGTATAPGWRTVSMERGPDDDVDVVFARGRRSVELEVYCNGGRPTVGDREVKTLMDD